MMFAAIAWLLLALVLGVVTLWAVWSRKNSKYRLWTLVSFLSALPVSAAIMVLAMGWAAPCKYVSLFADEYKILGFSAVPESLIYLFIQTPYGPKVCYIPWSTTKDKQLREGGKKGGTGSKLQTNGPFSMKGDPNIWNPPPMPLGLPKEGE